MKEKVYLQITSGRGPAECCRVVALVLERIVRQAQASGLKVEMIEREVGPVNRTLLSATIALQGTASGELADEWEERCNGLPKARIAFITSGKTGLSVCIRLCCRRVRRLQKEISAMKPYGLPVRAGSMSTRQSPRSVPFTSRPG